MLCSLQVFELMKKQEETRQIEENARRAEYQAMQAQHETVFRVLHQACNSINDDDYSL